MCSLHQGFTPLPWECDLLHWTCLKRDNTDKQPLRLPSWIIQLNSCEGGFGCPRPGTFVTSRLTSIDTPTLCMKERDGDTKLPSHMTNDWISYVSERMPEANRTINTPGLKRQLFEVNYYSVLKGKGFGPDCDKNKSDWAAWKERHRQYGVSDNYLDHRYFVVHKMDNLHDEYNIRRAVAGERIYAFDVTNIIDCIKWNINSDKSIPMKSMTRIGLILRAVYVNSIFKDISTTAVALNMHKTIALVWIIEHCLRPEMRNDSDVIMLMNVGLSNRDVLLEWLTSGSLSMFEALRGLINPALIIESVTTVKESIFASIYERNNETTLRSLYSAEFNSMCYNVLKHFINHKINAHNIMY